MRVVDLTVWKELRNESVSAARCARRDAYLNSSHERLSAEVIWPHQWSPDATQLLAFVGLMAYALACGLAVWI